MSLLKFLLVYGNTSGAPVNTVAPSLVGNAIVGETLTVDLGDWTGATLLEADLRHVGTGTVVDTFTADGTYVIQDTDFGQQLELYVVPDGNTGAAETSAATAPVAELPSLTLGSELVTNGGFSAWSGDNPTGWTVGTESAGVREITQVAPNGSAGTGAARYIRASGSFDVYQNILSVGTFYQIEYVVSAWTSGTPRVADANANLSALGTPATGTVRTIGRATSGLMVIFPAGNPNDYVFDSISCKALTPNTQLTAPSADMSLSQFYTLPASPVAGDAVWLLPRISDFAAGNYWLAFLRYTGSQWDINLYSVATHTRTSRANATNIGATNGLRVIANGDQLSLWTTANGGANWTQRGTTATNSTYQSATGVNALATSSVTLGQLEYADPN